MELAETWGISGESPKIIKLYAFGKETNVIIGSASGYPNSGFFPSDEEAMVNARIMAASLDLLALAKQYASECGGCRGTGLVTVHHRGMDCDDQPCLECADIRAVIARATGEQS